jgi:hypothetical protein
MQQLAGVFDEPQVNDGKLSFNFHGTFDNTPYENVELSADAIDEIAEVYASANNALRTSMLDASSRIISESPKDLAALQGLQKTILDTVESGTDELSAMKPGKMGQTHLSTFKELCLAAADSAKQITNELLKYVDEDIKKATDVDSIDTNKVTNAIINYVTPGMSEIADKISANNDIIQSIYTQQHKINGAYPMTAQMADQLVINAGPVLQTAVQGIGMALQHLFFNTNDPQIVGVQNIAYTMPVDKYSSTQRGLSELVIEGYKPNDNGFIF